MSGKKNKKKQYSNDSLMSWFTHITLAITYGLLFMFLVANILYSQIMPDEYFQLLQGKDDAFVSIIKRGKETSFFESLLPENKNTIAAKEADIFADTHLRKAQIELLKETLARNPESRDVLYALHLLYKSEGQMNEASHYLELARQIDPSVGQETP
ncbi:hypothetical protein IPM65_03075 [Candidatus Roizmanbacteria bacterium]|nr:MAG: hypothetical protein IPM65_03075 [Candidatus Roizmanbacteria bacterium]